MRGLRKVAARFALQPRVEPDTDVAAQHARETFRVEQITPKGPQLRRINK